MSRLRKDLAALDRAKRSIAGRDAASEQQQVVVAWTETAMVPTESMDTIQIDLGKRPRFEEVVVPSAAMWVRKGTAQDVASARAFIKREGKTGGGVFVYPASEKHPLERAREDVLR